jgi:hypothetical protein
LKINNPLGASKKSSSTKENKIQRQIQPLKRLKKHVAPQTPTAGILFSFMVLANTVKSAPCIKKKEERESCFIKVNKCATCEGGGLLREVAV